MVGLQVPFAYANADDYVTTHCVREKEKKKIKMKRYTGRFRNM